MTDFRLLGPLEATVDGEPLELPVGKPAALLARLLLDARRVVAVEALVDALWGEAPPPSAQKVLQGYVSLLRKTLGAQKIETRAPGYALQAAAGEIDLSRFEELTAAAHGAATPHRRAELLRSAIALWRGPALAEFRQEPFAARAGRRLEEMRLGALEARIEADLELGEHQRLVPELEALLAEDPLRERLRAALMLALYRSGRQAEALARYRQGRQLLVEQLGIAPAPALQDLERAILRQEPGLTDDRPANEPPQRSVIGVGAALAALLAPLCSDGRELILVELPAAPDDLPAATSRLRAAAAAHEGVRTASFTSSRPVADLTRLADEQGADLLVVTTPCPAFDELAAAATCDVALAARADHALEAGRPVLVPFGGGREEWAALELGAWLARSHGLRLHLLGAEATDGRRDASRTLAAASLALQRFSDVAAEPVLIPPGPERILAQAGSVIVAALPPGGLDSTRRVLLEGADVPVLLVRAGLRPGGLAPAHAVTRFSWSLRADSS